MKVKLVLGSLLAEQRVHMMHANFSNKRTMMIQENQSVMAVVRHSRILLTIHRPYRDQECQACLYARMKRTL